MAQIDSDQLLAELDAFLNAPEMAAPASPAAAVAVAPPAVCVDSPAPSLPARRNAGRTILLVEDNPDFRDMVKYLLESNQYTVLEASNGVEALALVDDRRPDLVVADFNMPQMNGFELIQAVRSHYETRNTPIIVMTGAANRANLRELFGADISRFLEKPLSNGDLLGAIDECLSPALQGNAEPGAPIKVSAVEKIYVSPARSAPAEAPKKREPGPAAPAAASPAPVSLESFGEDSFDAKFMDMVRLEEDKQPQPEEMGLDGFADDSPLISMVNKILVQAVGMRASDVHIEPQERNISVRVRLDGGLQNLCTLPAHLAGKLSARIKIMANLVITERRLPQDGMFKATIRGQKVEFRVSTLPCIHGEKIVLRVLGGSKLKGNLEEIGLSPRDRQCAEKAIASPHGLVLVTGPTGSGKTTTLYTMINVLNLEDVNIMTAEDPVEYQLPGISQTQVKASIGMTFETVLRSFLRQDPDIMLVGEIRDLETAEIAVKASVTGHLVLSTLHTNGAPATITRLTHMGLAPYLVAASVRLVVAQRLIKLLCPSCKIAVPASAEDTRYLTAAESSQIPTVHRAVGCAECRQTGYSGRKPIFEVMPVQSPEMRQLISSGQGTDLIHQLAVSEGMVTLRQAALNAVADGSASMEEALGIILSE